jgi:hypothetical protein
MRILDMKVTIFLLPSIILRSGLTLSFIYLELLPDLG